MKTKLGTMLDKITRDESVRARVREFFEFQRQMHEAKKARCKPAASCITRADSDEVFSMHIPWYDRVILSAMTQQDCRETVRSWIK